MDSCGIMFVNLCSACWGEGTSTRRVANRLVDLWMWGSHIHISFADIEPYLTATYNFSLLLSHCPEGEGRDEGRRGTGPPAHLPSQVGMAGGTPTIIDTRPGSPT